MPSVQWPGKEDFTDEEQGFSLLAWCAMCGWTAGQAISCPSWALSALDHGQGALALCFRIIQMRRLGYVVSRSCLIFCE